MKVSIDWLKELVNLKVSTEEVIRLLPLRTIGLKEVTENFFELDMKGYNRADLLSMRGVAREVAAITDSDLKFPESVRDSESLERLNVPKVKVAVEDSKLCSVYCIAKIEGLKVEPTIKEWVKKLEDSGIRTINNIADVTNLIMLEFGQPMHAFDAGKIADETLIVRLSLQGDALQTLDGKERKLDSSDLLITDPEKVLGIAGVMGGKDSEISNSTTTILLEAAIFDPVSIRRASQRHGLHSEASKRFQHGLTKTNLQKALSAAIKIYEDLGGKLTGLTVMGDLNDEVRKIVLTQDKINSLIGKEIPSIQVETSLKKLGFSLGANLIHPPGVQVGWEVIVPYWRLDINIEEDLIEEVARMYGYERIPAKELEGELPEKLDQNLLNFIYDLKTKLAGYGLTEVQTYSFYSSKIFYTLNPIPYTLIHISNPISSETEYLRDNIWPNLVEVVEKNLKKGYKDIAVFEIGKVYQSNKNGVPEESYRLAIALMNDGDNPIQELSVILSAVKNIYPSATPQDDNILFHPTRFTTIKSGDKVIGSLAEVHPRILNKFGIEKRVAILEISLDDLN